MSFGRTAMDTDPFSPPLLLPPRPFFQKGGSLKSLFGWQSAQPLLFADLEISGLPFLGPVFFVLLFSMSYATWSMRSDRAFFSCSLLTIWPRHTFSPLHRFRTNINPTAKRDFLPATGSAPHKIFAFRIIASGLSGDGRRVQLRFS